MHFLLLIANLLSTQSAISDWLWGSRTSNHRAHIFLPSREFRTSSNEGTSLESNFDLFSIEPYLQEAVDSGRKYLEAEVVQKDCWEESTRTLVQKSCKKLEYDNRARIAIALSNCHLAQSGLPTHPCPEESLITPCTKSLGRDPVAFNTYSTFFAHVDNICFYVQRRLFQKSTERVVNDLYTATFKTGATLKAFYQDIYTVGNTLSSSMGSLQERLDKHFEDMLAQENDRFEKLKAAADQLEANQDMLRQRSEEAAQGLLEQITRLQASLKDQAEETVLKLQTDLDQVRITHEARMLDAMTVLTVLQESFPALLDEVRLSAQQLGTLRTAQRDAVEEANRALALIQEKSQQTEQRLLGVMEQVQTGVDVLMEFDASYLQYLFRISGAAFYALSTIGGLLLSPMPSKHRVVLFAALGMLLEFTISHCLFPSLPTIGWRLGPNAQSAAIITIRKLWISGLCVLCVWAYLLPLCSTTDSSGYSPGFAMIPDTNGPVNDARSLVVAPSPGDHTIEKDISDHDLAQTFTTIPRKLRSQKVCFKSGFELTAQDGSAIVVYHEPNYIRSHLRE
eukprot:g42575.t1